ncbi:hypothetical protein SNOG_02583 [Parastagonospora nodorum SN15]|uniref:Uncharacterized protein n=1 Tax=Phaeosphaeria nodorum (strain SN15 / ATCC MYA-4574 / FGSC 10173) TaxID=321614 RepID=Q0V081_PHANO|nr:hypothetical protein SNOG_02583 [Parastagonospora nodorum SN15]EAT89314.2 hypothetical protein SNOG_02583 [Parastagonospora nodorum SN15]
MGYTNNWLSSDQILALRHLPVMPVTYRSLTKRRPLVTAASSTSSRVHRAFHEIPSYGPASCCARKEGRASTCIGEAKGVVVNSVCHMINSLAQIAGSQGPTAARPLYRRKIISADATCHRNITLHKDNSHKVIQDPLPSLPPATDPPATQAHTHPSPWVTEPRHSRSATARATAAPKKQSRRSNPTPQPRASSAKPASRPSRAPRARRC